jgi:hypothetical protein
VVYLKGIRATQHSAWLRQVNCEFTRLGSDCADVPYGCVLCVRLQLLFDAMPSLASVSRLRLVNAGIRGADASVLANALLSLRGLRELQLHQVRVLDAAVHPR